MSGLDPNARRCEWCGQTVEGAVTIVKATRGGILFRDTKGRIHFVAPRKRTVSKTELQIESGDVEDAADSGSDFESEPNGVVAALFPNLEPGILTEELDDDIG